MKSIFFWNLVLFFSINIFAQNKDSVAYVLNPIVVTANKIPTSSIYVNKSVDIINSTDIKNTGASCVEEVLQKQSHVNVQSRGTMGVQTDISIRGGSFSQQLILLNGMRINDVQTGHHNFDIPISTEQIEKIEIVKGAGSALYGPDAYSGIINIIPKVPQNNALKLLLSGGEYGYHSLCTNYDLSTENIKSSNVVEKRKSNDYHYNTAFDIFSLSTNNMFNTFIGDLYLFGGFSKKEFGANNYYGISPSKEWTETTLVNTYTNIYFNNVLIQPKISYRKHYDMFMYDIRTPNIYVNKHVTHVYNYEIQNTFKVTDDISIVSGIDGNNDKIISSNLGNHNRSSIGIFFALHGIINEDIIVDLGFRYDKHSQYGNQFNPTICLGYLIEENIKVFSSVARSFRSPSYTEIFYKNPKRQGNENLKPEIGWSYEAGIDLNLKENFQSIVTIFQRNQNNLIDYVKVKESDIVYKATNLIKARTVGAEISVKWINNKSQNVNTIDQINFNYTYLDSKINLSNVYSALYSFLHPRHNLSLNIFGNILQDIKYSATLNHKIKLNGSSYSLADLKISKSISNIELYLKASNIFNQTYEEIPNVTLPGRWIIGGIAFNILN